MNRQEIFQEIERRMNIINTGGDNVAKEQQVINDGGWMSTIPTRLSQRPINEKHWIIIDPQGWRLPIWGTRKDYTVSVALWYLNTGEHQTWENLEKQGWRCVLLHIKEISDDQEGGEQ